MKMTFARQSVKCISKVNALLPRALILERTITDCISAVKCFFGWQHLETREVFSFYCCFTNNLFTSVVGLH